MSKTHVSVSTIMCTSLAGLVSPPLLVTSIVELCDPGSEAQTCPAEIPHVCPPSYATDTPEPILDLTRSLHKSFSHRQLSCLVQVK